MIPYGKSKLYDLIFYMTFGIVIVEAVLIAGIFLVFILLIAPAASATLFCSSWKNRFILSWIIGVAGSVIGMIFSYYANISNGPAIVCILGITVFLLAFIKFLLPGDTVRLKS